MLTIKSKNGFILHFIAASLAVLCTVQPMYSQSPLNDTPLHPYHVDPWITGGIVLVGIPGAILGVPPIWNKPPVTNAELQTLGETNINGIDRWALKLDPSNIGSYARLSNNVLAGIVLFPALTLLDRDIRQDWLDVLLMYSETVVVTNMIYLYSPLGPAFLNRLRPVVYYDALGTSHARTHGGNRNSFYSGHVASAAAASFFTAKVFSDFHPELGSKKYLVYGAALLPPLLEGYLRMRALKHFPSDIAVGFGVGVLCGILVPELHRVSVKNISMGLYSSFEGTGIRLKWYPEFGT